MRRPRMKEREKEGGSRATLARVLCWKEEDRRNERT